MADGDIDERSKLHFWVLSINPNENQKLIDVSMLCAAVWNRLFTVEDTFKTMVEHKHKLKRIQAGNC